MKHLSTRNIMIASMALCVSIQAHTQTGNPKYEFGINLGFLVYQGDLTPERIGSFRTQQFALGIHASRIIHSSFSIRGNFLYGRLYGDDAQYDNPEFRKLRSFNFSSPAWELSGLFVWNPLGRNYMEKGFSPYVFAGGGLALLNIQRDWSNINTRYFDPETDGIWTGIAADVAHSLPRVLPVVPVGGGVKYFFHRNWAVNAEATYRFVRTDYLDGFSRSANPAQQDHYLSYTAGVIYRPGTTNKMACPAVNY